MATYNQIKKRLAKNNGIKEAPEKSDASFFERAWDSVLDLGTNVVAGGSQAVEGVIDAGLGIAGLFAGKDKKKEYAERIMYDWTGENILNPMEKHTADSYLNNNKIGETVENVAQGVGQMLPSVALSAIPYVGKALSMTSLFMRGVGSGMQESLSEGATYNQALGYGALSGSVELLTEGISAKLFGANTIDKSLGVKDILGKSLAKTEKSGLLKLAQDVAGEGLEEGISEFVNPLVKLTYKSLNETDFLSSEHIQRTIDSAVVGGLTSLVFKGTVGQLPAIKNSSKLADLQDQIIEYNDLSGKFYEDATSGKISAEEFSETEKQFNIRRNQIETEMSKILQEFGDATRQKILGRNTFLGQRFNSDGSVVQQGLNGTDLGVEAYNRDAYSVLDVNKEDSFVYKPSQTLSESAQETKQMIAQLSKAKGQPISYVFTDELNAKEKGGYKDGVIYINNRLQGSEMMTEVLKHEFTHSLENTKAYRQYSLFVLKTLLNNSTIATQLGIDVNADLKRLYDIYSKHGEINSSDPEIKQANILLSEIVAKYSSEKLFTDQESINRMCKTNPNLAQSIIRWIKDAIARFSGKTKAERETIAFLRRAERMYTRAIENARIDNGKNLQYSIEESKQNLKRIKGVNEKDIPLKMQDAIVNYVNKRLRSEYERSRKIEKSDTYGRRTNNETEGRNVNDYENKRREILNSYSRHVRSISKEFGISNNKEAIKFLADVIKQNGLFTEYSGSKLFPHTKDAPKSMQIVNYDVLPLSLKSIVQENLELGIYTYFYLENNNKEKVFGFVSPEGKANRLFLALDYRASDIYEILRHERTHYYQLHFKEQYNQFKLDIQKISNSDELDNLYSEYYERYKDSYIEAPVEIFETLIWDEVYAEIYSNHIKLKSSQEMFRSIERLESGIANQVNKKQGFKYSLDADSEGNQLTEAQAEFFKDSKVRDAEGNLLVVYHGTSNIGFTEFKGRNAYYTTDNPLVAKGYNQHKRDIKSLYKGYLNIQKPLVIDANKQDWYKLLKTPINKQLKLTPIQLKNVLEKAFGSYIPTKYSPADLTYMVSAINDLGYASYDGIIIKNIYDNLNYQQKELGNDYIFFESKQFKNTDNTRPTFDNDIRYALDTDDDIKDLVAIHNISENKLLEVINLGGLAVPSIAITKADKGHENFGDISLIFKKETIDPANNLNKVYDADVYSKRFPRVVSRMTDKSFDKFKEIFAKSIEKFKPALSSVFEDLNEVPKIQALERLENIWYFTKDQFLQENGINIEIPMMEVKNAGGIDTKYVIEFAKKHPEINDYVDTELVEGLREEIQAVFDSYYESRQSKFHFNRELHLSDLCRFADAVLKYNKNPKSFTIIDSEKLIKDIDAKVKEIGIDKYRNWLRDILTDLYGENSYFRNDRDVFDYYGNRRSFNQLYNVYNLENIVQYMVGNVRNEEGFNYGAGNIRSLLAKQYKTIEEIKADENKILSSKEMIDLKATSEQALYTLAEKIVDEVGGNSDNQFESINIAVDLLVDIAKTNLSDTSINREFKEYGRKEPSIELKEEIKQYMQQLKDMPTEYFEAKPQRVVEFDEVVKVFAPEGTSEYIIDFFEGRGISVQLYGENTPTRTELVNTLPSDIKFSLSNDDIWDEIFDASEEQADEKVALEQGKRTTDEIKLRAKLKQSKVYSKEELRQLISDAIGETPLTLKGKTREEVVSALFERMNTQDKFGKQETAEKIAEFIIKNAQVDNFDYESVTVAQERRNAITKYLKKIYLNDDVKSEIRHLFGKAGDGIIMAWGNKKGVEPFTVREELLGNGIVLSTESVNDADIFMDIYNAYIEARDTMQHLKETAKMYATELLTEEELKSFKQSLSEQILNAYNEKGSETQISKLLDNNNKIIKKLTKRILDTRAYAKSYVDFMTIQKKAKELLNKKYSASILEDEKMKAFLKVVSKATNIKTISKNARDYVRSLAEVYNKENHVFNITTEDDNLGNVISSPSDFDQNLADMIDYIATGEGTLTTQDLQIFTKITAGIIHLYKNYDAVIKNGVAVKTEDLAVRYIEELQEANKIRNSKGLLKLIWKIRQAIDPHAVFRNMDGYKVKFNKDLGINEDVGFFSEAYKEITDGEVKSAVAELELLKDFEDFFKNNKTFKKDLTKKMLKLKCKQVEGDKIHDTAEIEVSLDEAIAIYLTEQRPQANFYNTTIVLENKKGELVKYEVHKKDFDEFAKQFSALEKQYIKLVKDFFNVKAKNLKVETDNLLYGYTNIEEGDTYYPIKRESYSIVKNIGDEPNVSEVLTLWNLSFNKEVRKNAKLPLRINGVQTTIQTHARAMSLYYGLAIPLRNFNRVYNKSIKHSKHPISIRQITGEKMRGGEEYIRKLFNDLQGIRNDYSIGSKILRKARGLYAQYQLGFNLKTVMGQTSSYLMGVNYLDADSLAKGLTVKTKKADLLRYNKFARFRIEDKTIVKAEGVIDKVSKIGDIATKPIQWMDNNVVLKLWGACQVQIEKNTGYKVGTQDNLERAGKLLEVVVRETQSNSIMTEKTGLSRHQNELIASMTMFSSDAQKQLSRIIDGLGYKLATQERIKAGLLSKNSQEYKTASKQWIRATSGFILSSTMYVLIGMLFKWLLGKRDEEESLPEEFMGDFASQVAGLIPIFRDVYGYFENDYEINNYAFSMVNDMLSAVKDMWGLVDGIISGKELSKQDIAKPIRTSLYAIGMGTGMPVRNVYNYVYGLTSKFSPATAYKMNSLFYAPKVKDLDSAIENGNEKQSLAVVKELYQSRNLKLNDAYYNETLRLYKQGENIIPGKISETISYNGETFELEEKQHKQLIEVTNNSLIYISNTLNDKTYNNLTDKEKASYINNLYKINYVSNLLDIIGEDRLSENDTKKYLFAKCFSKNNDMLKHMAYVISMKSDKDKNGNTIYNSRKNKIVKYINSLKVSSAEKYLLMACAGFKNKNGEQQVKSYISKKGLSKEERDKIMEYCGY